MTSFYFLGTNSRKDITLVFAQELGLVDFVLEGDSEVVINSLRSNEVSFSLFGHLLESAKSMLVSSTCIKFSHVRRSGNKIAHNLATHARNVGYFYKKYHIYFNTHLCELRKSIIP